jgi:hypothetical protein
MIVVRLVCVEKQSEAVVLLVPILVSRPKDFVEQMGIKEE